MKLAGQQPLMLVVEADDGDHSVIPPTQIDRRQRSAAEHRDVVGGETR